MHPYFTHPVVLSVWTAAWTTAALFAWLTLSNALSIRGRGSDPRRLYVWFTALSSAHALTIALAFMPTSEPVKVGLFQLMWVLGAASLSYWVRAVREFCRSSSRFLTWNSRGLLLISAGALFDLLLTPIRSKSLMFPAETTPAVSLTMKAAGMSATVSPYGVVMGVLGVSLMLTACVVLYRELLRTGNRDPFLMFGIALSGVCTAAEIGLSATNSAYNMPIVFMANLIEAFRISWVTQRDASAELERIRQAKSQQAAIIERQLADLKSISRLAKVGENTARLSHDMRNPLTVALGSLDMIESELSAPAPDHAAMERLVVLARQSLQHVTGLAMKVTSQARPPTSETLSEVTLVSVIDDAWSLSPASGIRLLNDVDPNLHVLGRATELIQVFVNLLANAAQAQETAAKPWIRIEAEERERTVRVVVRDGGTRPSEETIDRMFRTPFTTHADQRGTGLGLSICKQIVTEHDGSIWVDREAPNTTIVVELPRPLAAAAQ